MSAGRNKQILNTKINSKNSNKMEQNYKKYVVKRFFFSVSTMSLSLKINLGSDLVNVSYDRNVYVS